MSYKIGGVVLNPQPTTGQWMARTIVGRDGNGRAIYEPLRKFELKWNVLDASEYNNLQDYFLSIGATGTRVVSLPMYTTGSYSFTDYTGCYVDEPVPGQFFSEHYLNVSLLVTNIVTEK